MSNRRSSFASSEGSNEASISGTGPPETVPLAPKDRSTGKVTWKGNVKGSAEAAEDPGTGSLKRGGIRPSELGETSRSNLSPLTPLNKSSIEGTLRPEPKNPSVGYAYSSPNLKSLNVPGVDQTRLMEDYLSGAMNRGNGNYVDPLYRHLNPSVGGNRKKPVWSLNQPLPHVLDQGLAEKMIQKNLEARSRASSRPGSTEVSRSGSMTSINDWKRFLRRAASNMKLTDIEAQLPNTGPGGISSQERSEHPNKPSHSQIEFAHNDTNQIHHNAKFSLGGESCQSSIANAESEPLQKAQTNRKNMQRDPNYLKEDFDQGAEITGVLDGNGGSEGDGIDEDDPDQMTFTNFWAKIRYRLREPFAEFLGTLVLVIFGVGGNLQATVTDGAGGSYESLSFAWGFGCMLGVYVAGGISGGHINPAVTISMAIFRKFPWKKVPVYIFAQIVGAFFGGAMAYGYFWSSITKFEGGSHIRTAATGACLFTNPKSYVTWRNAFFDEFIGAAMLVGCLMALLDDSNAPPANGMTALIVGFLVAAIGMALGYQTSFTINPARDLGPRIFASMIGYGPHAFHLTHWWWTWGGWGGPIAGGIAGALVYDLFIFTGCESPVNYPDNGYIEHRVGKLLHAEFHKHGKIEPPSIELDENSNSNSSTMKSAHA